MNSILVLDDETAICAEFARTLEGFGFNVKVAADVESGLSFAEATEYDAILVEFNLRSGRRLHPRTGNGLRLVRQLRALDIVAPVLMFTAMEGKFYETASFNAGADDFVPKTISIPILVSRLRVHIGRHQQHLGERRDERRSQSDSLWLVLRRD